MRSWSGVDTSDLVYGGREGLGLIVVPRAEAVRLKAIVDAVEGAMTWGELRRALPDGEWTAILDGLDVDEADAPKDDEPFRPDDLWGWADGDYPDWPAQRAFDWMPEDIIDAYGEEADSRLNGEFLTIDLANEAGLVEAFRARGARIKRDDELVLRGARPLTTHQHAVPALGKLSPARADKRPVRQRAIARPPMTNREEM